jgi:hypothetical protein
MYVMYAISLISINKFNSSSIVFPRLVLRIIFWIDNYWLIWLITIMAFLKTLYNPAQHTHRVRYNERTMNYFLKNHRA